MLNNANSPITFPSPNAIPPRTSSTGHIVPHRPSKSVLRPVPESDWLGQNERVRHHRHNPSATQVPSFPNIMQASAPPDPSRYATADFNFVAKKTWTEQKEKVLWGPYDYLMAHPGKDFRAQLIASFNTWLEVPEDSLDIITKVVGMLHTASLLVDDVEDNSVLRRGLPVAHSIFGTAQTINSANYVYFCALQELQKLKNPKVVNIYMEELLNLHRGQGMDLFWRDTLTCPTEEDYLEMVGNKTGGLFRIGIKLMQAESRSLIDCVELVNLMGLVYQIRDDYMNLSSVEMTQNKGLCEDLTEGKFSFPIIHSIRSDPNNLQLLNILKQKTTEDEVKRYAVKYMNGTGSFEYTRQVLAVLIERARRTADEIDDGKGKNQGIHKILDKMVVSP
ncbi:geranylgeranyl pyrophosphate synthase-like protein [Pseudomassariella vexata]|uniref:Geranylgeranyl pyrophosphate synthase-like protein n=1 Tax=Pseudomassariella vexata TaxID=1141098 RepID=A0A1Y2DWN6_9PEZI|nr:geranylgeranyl pyrophosphate synthase-like protein [Pseudomassariella vexata]ORY63035.1 geranylgeranyl pyrophosphate synthase-like protein [Pseudomassariella vexata]